MRWWLNTDHKRFSVDNAVINGMDFSDLSADIWMVQWANGKGEIERQIDIDTNDNGLRETFADIVPYCHYFQQFLARCPLLTIEQAKKVQIDLIDEVYNSKRQEPFCYEIAAGDYCWNATDETLFSSTAAGLQNATATLNALIDKVNSLAAQINARVVDGVNTRVVAPGNSIVTQVNTNIVNGVNTVINGVNGIFVALEAELANDFSLLASEINGEITLVGNQTIGHLNTTVLGTFNGGPGGPETVNQRLRNTTPAGPAPSVYGLTAEIAHNGFTFGAVNNYTISTYSIAGSISAIVAAFSDITAISWTDQGHVPVATAEWIPIGATEPVPVTPAEQAAILAGISARAADLNVTRNVKIGEVNALDEIDDVIAYDVTADW